MARFEISLLKGLVPPLLYPGKNLSQRIFEAHAPLRGLLEKDAKHLYIKVCHSLRTYGHKFFDVKLTEGAAKKKVTERCLGVGPGGLLVLDDRTLEVVFDWPLPQIVSWGSSSSYLFLRLAGDVAGGSNQVIEYHFATTRADEIARALTQHAKNVSEGRVVLDPEIVLALNDSPRCPPDPLLGHLATKTLSSSILLSKFEGRHLVAIPEELIRQMTLIEQDYFRQISLGDCLNHALKRPSTTPGAEAVKKLIRHFNLVSEWVSSEVVQEEDDEQRLKVLRNFIQLARMCRKHSNFNALMEVLSGLNSSPVQKFKETWSVRTLFQLSFFPAPFPFVTFLSSPAIAQEGPDLVSGV